MDKQNLETSLVSTIVNSDMKDIAIDMVELSLDSVLDDGLLKDLPFFGILAKFYSTGNTIHGKIYENKIIRFLFQTEQTDFKTKDKFNKKLENDPKLRKKIGEHLLVILDKFDDIEKASLLGKLFAKFMLEKIDLNLFLRFSSVISRAFLPDLKKLVEYENQYQFSSYTSTSLSNLGLVHRSYVGPETFDDNGKQTGGSKYDITELGKKLTELDVI